MKMRGLFNRPVLILLTFLLLFQMLMVFPIEHLNDNKMSVSANTTEIDRSLPPTKFNWRTEIGGVLSSMEKGPDGNIYFASDDGFLHCVRQDGTEKWSTRVETQNYRDIFFMTNGKILVGAWNKIFRLDENGNLEEILDLELRWADLQMHSLGDYVLMKQNDGDIIYFDPESADIIWKWESHRGRYTTNISDGGDNRFYAPTYKIKDVIIVEEHQEVLFTTEKSNWEGWDQYNLTYLDKNGNEKWNFTVNGTIHDLELIDDRILVRSVNYSMDSSYFYCLDLDGTLLWNRTEYEYSYLISDTYHSDKIFIKILKNMGKYSAFYDTLVLDLDGNEMATGDIPKNPSKYYDLPDGSYLLSSWNPDYSDNISRFSRNLSLLWKINLTMPISSDIVIGPDGTAYMILENGNFTAVSIDGRYLFNTTFSFNTNFDRYYNVLHGLSEASLDMLFGSDGDCFLGGVNLKCMNRTGDLQWEFIVGGEIRSSPVVSNSGDIIIGSLDHHLYSINEDGNIKWRYNCGGPVIQDPVVSKGSGNIVQVMTRGEVLCINPSGDLLWNLTINYTLWSKPVVLLDGSLIVNSLSGWLYGISGSGEITWDRFINRSSSVDSVMGPDGRIYMTVHDGLVCLSTSGDVIWHYKTERWHFSTKPVITEENRIYVAGDNLTCITTDGDLLWKSGWISDPTSIAVRSDGSIIIDVDSSGGIQCYSRDGEELWNTFIQGMPRVLLTDENDYTYLINNGLFCLGKDGEILWAYNNGDWQRTDKDYISPPIITDEGKIYYFNRALYCIEWDESVETLPLTPENFHIWEYYQQISFRQNMSEIGYPVMGYNLYRSTDNVNFKLYQTFPLNEYGWEEEDYEQGTYYYYYVTAFNQFGESPPTHVEKTDFIDYPCRPTPPRNFSLLLYPDKVIIHWDPPLSDGGYPITSYMIFKRVEDGKYELIARVDPDNFSYEDLDVDGKSKVSYYVAAENYQGWKNSRSITIDDFNSDLWDITLSMILVFLGPPFVMIIALIIVTYLMIRIRKDRPIWYDDRGNPIKEEVEDP